ncbi:NADH dehydrogenase subunit 5 [Neobacillus kokaensis]|uniref:Probable inorganic carbon transporter subunit DabB n=1 Tax=Neobacillus kokaensis TaxID=2759023 RepID=A0ABQ3N872_9BACI|nr:NADH dehydrogenase subunit 5 [Neobacillus kokaensis]GHI00199.1 putative NADH-quinone oxidoreductase subunit 5 [Neobacillus kokaensis]
MFSSLPTVFTIFLTLSLISALCMLYPRVPLSFVRIHVGIISFPPIIALVGLFTNTGSISFGPFLYDSLSWLLAAFVLTIGLIVQRYSIRYLLGDYSYRIYFALLTFTTIADALAWLSDDLRLLLGCWGATLFGLALLIRVNKEWRVARNAAVLSGRMFALSWILLLAAIGWLTYLTSSWQLSFILNQKVFSQIDSWERTGITLLLIGAVIIPAAQFPFQRWLLDSVVAPTPISAVMHAGIVNAGGIMLTRFAPFYDGNAAQIILLILSSISVLIGTGIMLVQVDYKRQLVGSTIAQMGFMLIQCALGAYLAAIIHAVLHGLFKSTLFLQAGSAVPHHDPVDYSFQPPSVLWRLAGGIIGIVTAVTFWLSAPEAAYQWVSALILGWSVTLAWTQLVAFGYGRIGRIAGLILLVGAAIGYSLIHSAFSSLLHETVNNGIPPSLPAVLLFFIILLAGSAIGYLSVHKRTSTSLAVIYLWLVQLGEPKEDMVESHPKYLSHSLSQGGHLN